jgi:uncharacterized membrane protein
MGHGVEILFHFELKFQHLILRGIDMPETKPLDEKIQKAIDKALYANGNPAAQKVRNFLNGTWLGEPLHAALTDVPVGAWTAAMVFDALEMINGRFEFATAADTSIAIGLAGAAGAAITGLTDWSDVDPPARRLGLIHGLLNIGATTLFATSLILRRKKARKEGRGFAALGYALASYSAHLGGKMVYEHRVGVDRTAKISRKLHGSFARSQFAGEHADTCDVPGSAHSACPPRRAPLCHGRNVLPFQRAAF